MWGSICELIIFVEFLCLERDELHCVRSLTTGSWFISSVLLTRVSNDVIEHVTILMSSSANEVVV